jgi:hypothetical protein
MCSPPGSVKRLLYRYVLEILECYHQIAMSKSLEMSYRTPYVVVHVQRVPVLQNDICTYQCRCDERLPFYYYYYYYFSDDTSFLVTKK